MRSASVRGSSVELNLAIKIGLSPKRFVGRCERGPGAREEPDRMMQTEWPILVKHPRLSVAGAVTRELFHDGGPAAEL
jgi:hypothetical protein